ncbi:FAD-binding protein [Yokenella regensburgei]|uniref:FAD-binding protein n=1 Tax=Yokenella regensburgei TaxID=158877 RepID=UPI003ED89A8C
MNIALVLLDENSEQEIARTLTGGSLVTESLGRWRVTSPVTVAEQLLDVLVEQWRQTPVQALLFPPGPLGDELATRLAWRLGGSSVCQALSFDANTGQVSKATYGNGLVATLTLSASPYCLSLARQPGGKVDIPLQYSSECAITPTPLPAWLCELSPSAVAAAHPLTESPFVLAVGQGAEEVDEYRIQQYANALDAEVGYSRARVMNGGVDVDRTLGISGHLLAPEVCIVVGASGAAAFSAGVRHSQFIVAINQDPQAAIFTIADVGIVDDWPSVLTALVECAKVD